MAAFLFSYFHVTLRQRSSNAMMQDHTAAPAAPDRLQNSHEHGDLRAYHTQSGTGSDTLEGIAHRCRARRACRSIRVAGSGGRRAAPFACLYGA
jgi:hypothetical protein